MEREANETSHKTSSVRQCTIHEPVTGVGVVGAAMRGLIRVTMRRALAVTVIR